MYADLSRSLSLARKVDGGFAIETMLKGPGLHAGAGVYSLHSPAVELQARRRMDFGLFTPPAPCSRAVRAGANIVHTLHNRPPLPACCRAAIDSAWAFLETAGQGTQVYVHTAQSFVFTMD